MAIYVTRIETPFNFHCQLAKSSTTDLPLLMDQIQDCCSSLTEVSEPTVGQPCIGQYLDDWYRAEIIRHHQEDTVEVLFVDYGNREVVTKSQVKVINSDLTELPVQSFQCRLHSIMSVADDGSWDENSCSRFEELVNDKKLSGKIVFMSRDERGRIQSCNIELYEGETNIREMLIEAGYAKSSDSTSANKVASLEQLEYDVDLSQQSLEPDSVMSVLYMKGGQPDHFSCQLADSADALEALMQQVAETAEQKQDKMMKDIKVGEMCLAKYTQDNAWYRATVIDIQDNTCQVG